MRLTLALALVAGLGGVLQPGRVFAYTGPGALGSVSYDEPGTLEPVPLVASNVAFASHDADGQPTLIRTSLGQLALSYDDAGRVQGIRTAPRDGVLGAQTLLGWRGDRLETRTGLGIGERRCYDGSGRITAILTAAGSSAPASCDTTSLGSLQQLVSYHYDATGGMDLQRILSPGESVETRATCDGADRLTKSIPPDGKGTFRPTASIGRRRTSCRTHSRT